MAVPWLPAASARRDGDDIVATEQRDGGGAPGAGAQAGGAASTTAADPGYLGDAVSSVAVPERATGLLVVEYVGFEVGEVTAMTGAVVSGTSKAPMSLELPCGRAVPM